MVYILVAEEDGGIFSCDDTIEKAFASNSLGTTNNGFPFDITGEWYFSSYGNVNLRLNRQAESITY